MTPSERNRAYYAKIGQRINMIRIDKRLNIEQLAQRSGLQTFHIVRLEAGDLPVGDKLVGMVAKGLGIRKSEISEDFEDD